MAVRSSIPNRGVFVLEWSGRSRPVAPTVLKLRLPKPRVARAEVPELSGAVRPATSGSSALARDAARPIEGPKALGALLCERGLLTEAQLQIAILRQQQTGRRLGHVLVELGLVTPEAVLEVLRLPMGVPPVRINAFTANTNALHPPPQQPPPPHPPFPP